MESNENDPFDVASMENTKGLLTSYFGFRTTEEFLRNDSVHVPLFPTIVYDASESLVYSFDFDGIVVQLADVSEVTAGIHYLFAGNVDGTKLCNNWHFLKKHFVLQNFSAAGVSALQKSVGIVLGYVDGGYFLNLTCIPANPNSAHPMFKSQMIVKAHAIGLINALFANLSMRLKSVSPEDLERPTLQKTNLSALGRINILSADQKFILQHLHQAYLAVNDDIDMAMIMTITKFGQKDQRVFDLNKLVNPSGLANVSYHVACNIRSRDPSVDILWSRYGLQEVVGQRGSLFPVYSMAESANYQSNLDHMPLNVKDILSQVLRVEDCRVNFLQLYAVTPHCHQATPAKHPVSRVITTCDLHIEKHRRMILKDAKTYVEHMDDLALKTRGRTFARMEGVFLVDGGFPNVVDAKEFFDPMMLDNMLEVVPMLLPFKDNNDGLGLRHIIHRIATYLTSTLFDLLHGQKGLGGYESSWKAFQIELALEHLFYGRGVCVSSRQYAAPLGVCSSSSNSISRARGVLGLSPIGSASVGEGPPPLDTWISEELQKLRVLRLFPLTDCLHAGMQVVGEELVRILLCDLHERNDRIDMASWKGPNRPIGRLCDCRTVGEFSRELCEARAFGYPHTFGRALEMVTSFSYDPVRCLQLGLGKLKYFPKIKYWDEQRNKKARWNFKDYVELHTPTQIPSAASRAAAYLGDVCAKIEVLDLSYSRNLVKYRENGMPWLETCIERLPKALPKDRLITVLAFLGSIGMIHNGDFVSFQKLGELERQLPVTQRHMKELRILSPLLLIQSPQIWRFHESVDTKLVLPLVVPAKPAPPRPPLAQDRKEVPDFEVDEQPEEEVIVRVQPSTVPANVNERWTQMETGYINVSRDMSHIRAYDVYLRLCRENSTPVRTFNAFKRKRQRLMAVV